MNASVHQGRTCPAAGEPEFDELALELFRLQHSHNPVYRAFCRAKGVNPGVLRSWREIPAMPASAFKEYEVTCLEPGERRGVFRSSGTSGGQSSRNFHNSDTLEVYNTSLWLWFHECVGRQLEVAQRTHPVILMPPPHQAPDSSLVHMMEIVRTRLGASSDAFVGLNERAIGWRVDAAEMLARLEAPVAQKTARVLLLGTAFGFVQLLDWMAEHEMRLFLPDGSVVFETGGYKGRSRFVARDELHALIEHRFGVPRERIVSEYGMSELASQGYDVFPRSLNWSSSSTQTLHSEGGCDLPGAAARGGGSLLELSPAERVFRFPPWARVTVVSPETGNQALPGEPGLLRIVDLANVGSVLALQSEDLGIAEGDGFTLLGRSATAEAKGCSLLVAE